MIPNVHLTATARSDLDAIWDEIAAERPAAADRVIDRIAECCRRLSESPRIGQICQGLAPDLPDDLRQFTALPHPYVVFYRPTEDGIIVYRVLHGHRDIPETFRRQPLSE